MSVAAGLTAGHDALLCDFMAPVLKPVSLRDGSAAAALRKLAERTIDRPEDIYEVGTRRS